MQNAAAVDGFSRSHSLFTLSTLRISPSMVSCCDRRFMFPSQQRIYRPTPTRCRSSITVALLLLMGGVELNPGPAVSSASTIPCKRRNLAPSPLQVGCLNCRSAAPKISLIHDLISDYALDILFLSETWFNSTTPQSILLDLAPSGYAALHVVRPTGAGGPSRCGGLGVVFHQSVPVRVHHLANELQTTTFELQLLRVGTASSPLTFVHV